MSGTIFRNRLRLGALIITFTLSCALPAFAKDFSTPTALTNVTAIIEPGNEISNATILMKDGRIVQVGANLALPADTEVFDGTGLYAYAGFIDAATHLGIKEMVRAMPVWHIPKCLDRRQALIRDMGFRIFPQ